MKSPAERIEMRAAMERAEMRDAMVEGSSGGPVAQGSGVNIRSQRLGEAADALELYLTGSEAGEDQRLSQHGWSTADDVRHPSLSLLSLNDERASESERRVSSEASGRPFVVEAKGRCWEVGKSHLGTLRASTPSCIRV